MTVIDASVLVDALVNDGEPGTAARAALLGRSVLEVPAIFKAEATSALQALVHRGELSSKRALDALAQVQALSTVSYPFEPFLGRVWDLRENLTVYDAWYVALAESLDTDLVTADARLVAAPGPRCTVRLVGSNPSIT